MSNLVKKVRRAAFSASFLALLLSGSTAAAQTMSIDALMAQIAALQAQIMAMQSGGSMTSGSTMTSSCTFTRSLTVGSRGADVKCLQGVLKAAGHLSIASTTDYFGAMTKAAVSKWQAAAGVTPASGFFGPLSRAKLAMNGPVVVNPNPNPNPAPVPMSGVMVSLSANQPMGSAIAGAGQLDVAKFTFTASNAAGATISSIKFIRTGVVSDSNISNLYLADESGVIFAQYSSLNNGVAMFDGINLQVNAGQSRVVTLRMDLSSSASAGNTLGWQLAMATASNGT